jgi:hypothetical protein
MTFPFPSLIYISPSNLNVTVIFPFFLFSVVYSKVRKTLYLSPLTPGLAFKNPPKKPTQKKTKKTRFKKAKKTHPQVGFFGFFLKVTLLCQ